MTSDRGTFLIDSNVLVYTLDVSEEAKQLVALDVVARLGVSGRGRLSVQVLGESFNAMTRKIKPSRSTDEAETVVLSYAATWPVLDLTPQLAREAIRGSREHQMSYWDAQIWATAKLNGIPTIITEDRQDGRTIEGVMTINPFAASFDLGVLD